MKRTTPSFWRGKRAILVGFLTAGSIAGYFLAPVPGGITGLQITGSGGTAPRSVAIPPIDESLPGVTETATFALG